MTVLQILKIICALGTIATGFLSLIGPRSVKGFTGLDVTGPRGVTEIRAVLGGLFIGLGVAPFILGTPSWQGNPLVYQAIGVMYLAIAAVRLVSMFVDKSIVQSNIISLIVEIIFGSILVI